MKTPVFSEGTAIEWIGIARDGNQIVAMVGPDLQEGLGGFGVTIADALRDLADQMEKENWRSAAVD